MYNGPSFTPWNKWIEVQIPIRVKDDSAAGGEVTEPPAKE